MYEQENIKPYNKNKEKGPQVALMFDNIAHSYDFLNHFLSLGIDKIWRRKAIMGLRKLHPAKILDVATGTADFAILSSRLLHPQQVTGIDISEGMLEVGRQKVEKLGIDNIVLEKGDCMHLAFDDGTFDAVTVAYGVRNFASLDQGLREICRVLKPGGRLVILELSRPEHFPMKQLFDIYSRVVMTFMGHLFSHDSSAYEYLPATMKVFPHSSEMRTILQIAGFRDVRSYKSLFDMNTRYEADK